MLKSAKSIAAVRDLYSWRAKLTRANVTTSSSRALKRGGSLTVASNSKKLNLFKTSIWQLTLKPVWRVEQCVFCLFLTLGAWQPFRYAHLVARKEFANFPQCLQWTIGKTDLSCRLALWERVSNSVPRFGKALVHLPPSSLIPNEQKQGKTFIFSYRSRTDMGTSISCIFLSF